MSSLDIGTTASFYRPSPAAVEYMSPAKLNTTNALAYSRSPMNSEQRSLSNYYELKNNMEMRYISDLDRVRAQAQEADLRREMVEKENILLAQELNYWKNKNASSDRERNIDLELKDQLTRSHLNSLKKSVGSQHELLNVEIETLRNQLHEKMREVDQWRKVYFDQELRSAATRANTEGQLKAYEGQLNILLSDIQGKIDQATVLQQDNASLQSQTSKLTSVQSEVRDVRSLLDYNYEESQKLKQELTNQQIDNYRLRKSELSLKEQEQRLLTQIEIIQNKITSTNSLKEIELERADRLNNELLEKIKQEHQKVKDALDLKKLTYSQLIVEKEKNVEDLRLNIESVKDRIGRTRIRGSSSKKEADEWRQRHRVAEDEQQVQVQRINTDREKSVDALRRSHVNEKIVLEGRINSLRTDLNAKEDLIRQQNQNLTRSRLEKNNLDLEKRVLQNHVEQKRLQGDEQDRVRAIQLDVKQREQQRQTDALRNSSLHERAQLEQQERVLSTVLDAKQREALEAKNRAAMYHAQAIDAERKVREKSIETDVWRSNYVRTDREKSLEVDAARSLRRSQIELAQRTHELDMHAQDRNKAALMGVLDYRVAEVSNLHNSNSNLIGELIHTQQDTRRANVEAHVWRTKAEIEERDRNNQLFAQDLVQNSEINNIRRSQLVEGTVLRSEINNLNSHIDYKDREANDWRNNYNRIYTNTFNR